MVAYGKCKCGLTPAEIPSSSPYNLQENGRGRPRNTWRRELEVDTRGMGYTWKQFQNIAEDKGRWKAVADTLCPRRGDRHK